MSERPVYKTWRYINPCIYTYFIVLSCAWQSPCRDCMSLCSVGDLINEYCSSTSSRHFKTLLPPSYDGDSECNTTNVIFKIGKWLTF